MKYYYKITSPDRKSIHAKGSLAITYTRGRWTKPQLEGSKIFIFDSLGKAKYNRWGENRIFKCLAKNPKKFGEGRLPMLGTKNGWRTAKTFWTGNRENTCRIMSPPWGTLVADAVKVVEEIL